MSLMKRCQEYLEDTPNTDDSKYRVMAFVIRSEINEHKHKLTLKERQKLYSDKITYYSKKYGLLKSKLGKTIATGEVELGDKYR